LTKQAKNPETGGAYPARINSPAKRALYDNLGRFEQLALWVDAAILANRQDDWRNNSFKVKKVKNAIAAVLREAGVGAQDEYIAYLARTQEEHASYALTPEETVERAVLRILELVKKQDAY
jgi:type I restriction enzyme, R subunit